jgi:hypothetical protein
MFRSLNHRDTEATEERFIFRLPRDRSNRKQTPWLWASCNIAVTVLESINVELEHVHFRPVIKRGEILNRVNRGLRRR